VDRVRTSTVVVVVVPPPVGDIPSLTAGGSGSASGRPARVGSVTSLIQGRHIESTSPSPSRSGRLLGPPCGGCYSKKCMTSIARVRIRHRRSSVRQTIGSEPLRRKLMARRPWLAARPPWTSAKHDRVHLQCGMHVHRTP